MTPIEAHTMAWKNGYLPMWTVYDRPRDYPAGFIARMHVIGAVSGPTFAAIKADTLDEVRRALPPGLFRIDRAPGDDPNIVEVWM